jgi:hypothetical protein
MNTKQKLKDLEEMQRRVADDQLFIANKIEALREKLATPEPVVPWEPSGGSFYIEISGATIKRSSIPAHPIWTTWTKAGRSFKTEEAAAKASEFFTFYQRLYQLALECNAKHGSRTNIKYSVYVFADGLLKSFPVAADAGHIGSFFTSYQSAQEACEIMNRDRWVVPTL